MVGFKCGRVTIDQFRRAGLAADGTSGGLGLHSTNLVPLPANRDWNPEDPRKLPWDFSGALSHAVPGPPGRTISLSTPFHQVALGLSAPDVRKLSSEPSLRCMSLWRFVGKRL
jgi:hypothetical protein